MTFARTRGTLECNYHVTSKYVVLKIICTHVLDGEMVCSKLHSSRLTWNGRLFALCVLKSASQRRKLHSDLMTHLLAVLCEIVREYVWTLATRRL